MKVQRWFGSKLAIAMSSVFLIVPTMLAQNSIQVFGPVNV
jgi:hypothetical protein